MTIKSGVIGNDEYMDLCGKLNETSRVQRFEIGGIKIFFYWSTENNLFSDCKRWLKGACSVWEMMKCECYQSQW